LRSAKEGLRIHVVPHSHIDTEWYWTRKTAEGFGIRTARAALDIMRRDPEFCFSQDQVTIVEPVLRALDQGQRRLLRQRLSQGNLEMVGGMYVQPEVAEPNGECLVRQILYGKRWFERILGVEVECAWNIDTFGQCTQLPQILSKSGYRCLFFGRGVDPALAAGMPSEFYYESPDGSRMLTHWMSGHYAAIEDNVKSVLAAVCAHRTANVVLLPWGSDISVPAHDSEQIRSIVAKAAKELDLQVDWIGPSTPSRFLQDRLSRGPVRRVFRMDFNPPLNGDLRGTYDNRVELKKLNRETENWVLCAEKLAALAWIRGLKSPKDFDDLWINLIYTHFHDIIGGSHYDAVYRDAMQRLSSTKDRAERLAVESAAHLAGGRKAGRNLAVFNCLSFSRSEICTMEVGPDQAGMSLFDGPREIPTRTTQSGEGAFIDFLGRDLPGLGYRKYGVRKSGGTGNCQPREIDEGTIENEFLRVSVDSRTGSLNGILHKPTGWEVLAGSGNQLVGLEEEDPDMEGRLSFTGRVHKPEDFGRPRVAAFEDGLGSWIDVQGTFLDFTRVQRISLYRGMERVDMETSVLGYKGANLMLEVRFPLNLKWDRARACYETPFAVTERPFEQHFCTQTFVDCHDGQRGAALLNRGTAGHWIRDGSLDMVIMRSFSAFGGYYEARKRLGLDYENDDSRCVLAREEGDHRFHYALYPHLGSWRASGVTAVAHSYNSPPLCVPASGTGASSEAYFATSPKTFEIVALKRADGDLVVRGYETLGRRCKVRLRLPFRPRSAWISTLLEQPTRRADVAGNTISFSCLPHEIVTIRIKRTS